MPIYEYRCKACGKTHEIEHGFNDPRPTQCSACGGQLVRVFHPIGLVFKGSGFHKTDYGKTSSASKSPAASSDSKPADGKSQEPKPAAKPAESKSPESKPADAASKPASDASA